MTVSDAVLEELGAADRIQLLQQLVELLVLVCGGLLKARLRQVIAGG